MNEDEVEQLNELNKVWPKLSRHQRDIILLTAGLIKLPRDRHGSHRTPHGASSEKPPRSGDTKIAAGGSPR